MLHFFLFSFKYDFEWNPYFDKVQGIFKLFFKNCASMGSINKCKHCVYSFYTIRQCASELNFFIGPHKKVWNIFTEILTSVGWSALRYAQKNKMVGDFHSNRFLYRCVLPLQFFWIVKIEKKLSNMYEIWKKQHIIKKIANKFRWKSCTIFRFSQHCLKQFYSTSVWGHRCWIVVSRSFV